MTHIDTDEHSPHFIKDLWEFQIKQVPSALAVDLAQDIASLRGVERLGIANSDDLGWHFVLLEYLLDHAVLALLTKNEHNDLWMAENTVFRCHHVIKKL